MKKGVKKGDLILIAALLLLAGVFFLLKNTGSTATTAEVICNNETVLTIDLADVQQEYTQTLPNGMILSVSKNAVSIVESDCRDKLCIHCGSLSANGDTAVCLPNRTIVKVSGEKQKNTPDILTY